MLIVFDLSDRPLAFTGYGALFNHYRSVESTREKDNWVFTRHSWPRMMACYRYVHARACPTADADLPEWGPERALRRAGATVRKPDVLEIVKGDPRRALFVPLNPDIDIRVLLKEWCLAYCRSHGHRLFETSGPDDFREIGGKDDSAA